MIAAADWAASASRWRRRRHQRQHRPGHRHRFGGSAALLRRHGRPWTAGCRLPRPATSTTFGHWDILSPGTAYNVLTVGGIDDRNTAGRSDDRIWYYPGSNGSNYRDPSGTAWNSHGDFNKPNVSAPAASVTHRQRARRQRHERRSPDRGRHRGPADRDASQPGAAARGTRALIMAGAINRVADAGWREELGSRGHRHGIGTVGEQAS